MRLFRYLLALIVLAIGALWSAIRAARNHSSQVCAAPHLPAGILSP
jgi:hypothetical protein